MAQELRIRSGLNVGLVVVFVVAVSLGALAYLVFFRTDFGLPEAAITRTLFQPFTDVTDIGVDIDVGFDAGSLVSGYEAGFNLFVWAFAFVFPVAVWLVVMVRLVRRLSRFRSDVGERSDADDVAPGAPPSADDPALVATLWGNGTPGPEAIAGTVLSLAVLNRIEIQHLAEGSFVLRLRPDGEDPTVAEGGRSGSPAPAGGTITPSQAIVLEALRREAGSSPGHIDGPPLWRSSAAWWPAFRTDAQRRAAAAGLAVRAASSRLVMLAVILTAVAYVLVRSIGNPVLFFLLAIVVPVVAALFTSRLGYALTTEGRALRTRWATFADHLAASDGLGHAPPAAVVIEGLDLAYAAVLGVAREAARELTPDVDVR